MTRQADSQPSFGDRLLNPAASVGNPTRIGVFVETIVRRGRMNPGRWARLTDKQGLFWEVMQDSLVRCDDE